MPSLFDLATPCALVERGRVESNTTTMRDRARRLGVRLRGHVKTHKSVPAARLQVGDGPITVSTAAEARHFAAAGFLDQTWAVPLPPSKVATAAALIRAGVRLRVLVDSDVAVDGLVAEARRTGLVFSTFLKVDCGYGRAGVDPATEAAVVLGRRLASTNGVRFAGLLTHGGHSYDCIGRRAVLEVARQERDVVVGFAERLRARSVDVPEVSLGSTPTCAVADDLPGGLAGVTEIRPGNYVYFDATQAAIGTCTLDDCAFSVLVTVLSVHADRGVVLTDGGALAVSKDPGPTHAPGARSTYGPVFDALLQHPLDVDLAGLSQEHGKLKPLRSDADLRTLRVGDRLRVIVNHSCLAAAAHAIHHVVDGEDVVDQWEPCRGW